MDGSTTGGEQPSKISSFIHLCPPVTNHANYFDYFNVQQSGKKVRYLVEHVRYNMKEDITQ